MSKFKNIKSIFSWSKLLKEKTKEIHNEQDVIAVMCWIRGEISYFENNPYKTIESLELIDRLYDTLSAFETTLSNDILNFNLYGIKKDYLFKHNLV